MIEVCDPVPHSDERGTIASDTFCDGSAGWYRIAQQLTSPMRNDFLQSLKDRETRKRDRECHGALSSGWQPDFRYDEFSRARGQVEVTAASMRIIARHTGHVTGITVQATAAGDGGNLRLTEEACLSGGGTISASSAASNGGES